MIEKCPDCQHPMAKHNTNQLVKILPSDPDKWATRCNDWDCLLAKEPVKCTKISLTDPNPPKKVVIKTQSHFDQPVQGRVERGVKLK